MGSTILFFRNVFLSIIGIVFVLFISSIMFRVVNNGAVSSSPQPSSTTATVVCTRSSPYLVPPEFERALSLIIQRQDQNKHPYFDKFQRMRNCLDIRYTDIKKNTGAEGAFYFDSSVSSANKLVIEVDNSYSYTDDISTAYLLSHELTHARQYLEVLSKEKTWSCVESEVEAFYEQMVFGSLLNGEESRSVISRLEQGTQNSQLKQYDALLDFSWNAIRTCGGGKGKMPDTKCYQQTVAKQIRQMITSSPAYQKQCEGEL